jgi:hypothetical protein
LQVLVQKQCFQKFPETGADLQYAKEIVFDSSHRYQWIEDRFTVDTESGNGRIDVALPQVNNAVAYPRQSEAIN